MRKEDIRNKVRKQLWSYYCENKLTYDNLYDALYAYRLEMLDNGYVDDEPFEFDYGYTKTLKKVFYSQSSSKEFTKWFEKVFGPKNELKSFESRFFKVWLISQLVFYGSKFVLGILGITLSVWYIFWSTVSVMILTMIFFIMVKDGVFKRIF